jgi:hypothetical protein
MQSIKDSIEIPLTKELQELFLNKYQGKTSNLVEDFLIYLNTKKEAYDIDKALSEVKEGKTRDIGSLLNEL